MYCIDIEYIKLLINIINYHKFVVNCIKIYSVLHKITFFILLLFFSHIGSAAVSTSDTKNTSLVEEAPTLIYKNKILFVQGIRGQGVVEVYSIIGNKIVEMNVSDLSNARIPIYLKSGHMYIVRIRDQKNNLKTFKILAS